MKRVVEKDEFANIESMKYYEKLYSKALDIAEKSYQVQIITLDTASGFDKNMEEIMQETT